MHLERSYKQRNEEIIISCTFTSDMSGFSQTYASVRAYTSIHMQVDTYYLHGYTGKLLISHLLRFGERKTICTVTVNKTFCL